MNTMTNANESLISPSLSKRKWAVVLAYSGTLVLTVTRLAGTNLPVAAFIVLLVLSLAASGYGLVVLFRRTSLWAIGNNPDTMLDERQARTRDAAYRIAYSLVSTLTFMGLFYASIAVDKHLWLPRDYSEVSTIMWAAFVLLLTLPSTVLAWSEREI
jgi:hypothetical protein